MKLTEIVGSGDRIGLFSLPFIISGLVLSYYQPSFFAYHPSPGLKLISFVILAAGIINWLWSVYLLVTLVPRHKLITAGPYLLVKHPLYTGMALLVLPWAGILLHSWLGVVFGLVVYIASRLFSPAEEQKLSKEFGPSWRRYLKKVLIPWL